ncbi:MAG TPA: DUF3093 domain-containing protein [Cellulomonas sp.]
MPEPDDAFRERLWPGPGGWLVAVGLGALVGLVVFPVSVPLAWSVGAVAVAVAVGLTAALTPRVEVAGGELRAGSAHIPLHLLSEVTPLSGDTLRAALGPELDARAYVCLRGWVHGAVRVELTDPADPTPYWIVSTRRPSALVAALAAAGHVA